MITVSASRFRPLVAILLTAGLLPAWTMSVEFPYTGLPRYVWERELAHLKEMGVVHVSLPRGGDDAKLDEVIRIVRRLGLEADLEGPLPARLDVLSKAHGGPLTGELTSAMRLSAAAPSVLTTERHLILAATPAIVWTDVFETLSPGFHPGAISLAGAESANAALVRREAQLARFWGGPASTLPESPGARLAVPADGVTIHQFVAEKTGLSLVSVTNDSAEAWKGEIHVLYPYLQRPIALSAVAVGAHDSLWLPVNIPLTESSLCFGCNGFAPSDHLAWATVELTAMEYENGILAMEFVAPVAGEVVLQLSHEPPGPLVAGGHPAVFDWDAKTQRARLPIPAGNAKTGRVRVALAVDAPGATGFFQDASVLIVGETSRLQAEFSPPAVAARSRVRASADLTVVREEAPKSAEIPAIDDKDKPALVTYRIAVPPTAVPGDIAHLAIEADGMQLGHSELRVLPAVTLGFADAVSVRLAANSSLPIMPAVIPVKQKPGREITLTLHNNAPEIRTFDVAIDAPGLEFSPEKVTVSVGALLARDVTFHVFSSGADPGVHEGTVKVSGAAAISQPVRFVVVPPEGSVDWTWEGFSLRENTRFRASFLAGRWLEMIDKDSGQDLLPPGGGNGKFAPMEELERLAPAKH